MRTDIIKNVTGLWMLTPEGELGCFGPDQAWAVDAGLTTALKRHNQVLLQAYHAGIDEDRLRLAVIGRPAVPREWGLASLFLEEHVVRDLYPIGSGSGAELTAFQRKNQEKSVYRGLELLLEYRHAEYPAAPVYCPVLYDRGVVLGRYPGIAGAVTPANASAGAIDVLNLVGQLSFGHREMEPYPGLAEQLHASLVRKELRRDLGLEIQQSAKQNPGPATGKLHAEVEARSGRPVSMPEAEVDRAVREQLVGADQWTPLSPKGVDVDRLRQFTPFRTLAPGLLTLVHGKAQMYTAAGGARLLERGSTDPWNFYLLEGSILLEASDGAVRIVDSSLDTAKSPIAFLKPRKYRVSARSSVTFLLVHDLVLRAVGLL